jgi:hypothetical protein
MYPVQPRQSRGGGLLTRHARHLGEHLTELGQRVRQAVAASIGEALAGLAQEAVNALLVPPRPAPQAFARYDDPRDELDPWAENLDDEAWSSAGGISSRTDKSDPPPAKTLTRLPPAVLAAGLGAASWWLRRSGSLTGAVGVGLAAGVIAALGGRVAADGLDAAQQHL